MRNSANRPTRRVGPASPPLRVLIVAHMHPRVSRGGAEIAAYQMYSVLRAMPDVRTWFAAASGGKVMAPLGAAVFQPFGPDEFVMGDATYDHWTHTSMNASLAKEFRPLLEELKPDIVHFHHFANIGVEAFLHVRQAAPQARIVLTLHEFLAICNHFGQMVKRPSLELCERATARDCARCFPERSENDFFLRRLYLQRFLGLVDGFIAPSRFLADRYIDWGLEADRFSVIENGQAPNPGEAVAPPDPATLIVGFFGQLSTMKGVGVLLDAAEELRRRPPKARRLRIEIHGDASNQPPELRDEIERRLRSSHAVISFRGPYDNLKVHALMANCHAVLVPSIWWENSPMVIQEAFAARRPVICSDIGGMAEKVRDGLDGFHFRARDGRALADLLRDLADKPEKLAAVEHTLAVPPTLEETVTATRQLYERLLAGRAMPAAA
jgi:glycosyltransferase involved in cell wall biosynthesis